MPGATPRPRCMAGVTTAREVGAGDFIDVALRNAINAGLTEGPRMLVAGHALGSTGGHCDSSPFPPERVKPSGPLEGVCNGPEQCREATRLQMKYGADLIKICASGGVLSESDPVDVPQLTPKNCARSSAKRTTGTARSPRTAMATWPRSWRWKRAWIRSSTAVSSPPPRCS